MTTASKSSMFDPENVEFTFDWYDGLLGWLDEAGYTATTFDDGVGTGDVLIRHDVDLSPRKAVVMGRLEADHDITSTYFFLVTSPIYNLLDAPNRRILEELVDLGHRVGLHFSTHQYWQSPPSADRLRRRVEENRSILSVAAPDSVDTVSFHCPPDWALNRSFPGVEHTYEPRFFSEIAYAADSGQRWREQTVLGEPIPETLQLLTHPGLWGQEDEPYIHRVTIETKTNVVRAERSVLRELVEDRFEAIDYPYQDVLPERYLETSTKSSENAS